MDIARQVAQQSNKLPDYQVHLGALEQQGIGLAGQTGVGASNSSTRYKSNQSSSSSYWCFTDTTIFKSISIIYYWRNRKTISNNVKIK